MNTSAALDRMVRLNEGIKDVVLIAFRINLMSLNAILLSRRAGDLARGFGVISLELCTLSVALSALMRTMSSTAFVGVRELSIAMRQQHRHVLLGRARAGLEDEAQLDVLLQRGEQTLQAQADGVARRDGEFASLLEDAERLCQFGIVLSRSAKVEAAYGQTYSQSLREIAQEFDVQIQTILPRLARLRTSLKDDAS